MMKRRSLDTLGLWTAAIIVTSLTACGTATHHPKWDEDDDESSEDAVAKPTKPAGEQEVALDENSARPSPWQNVPTVPGATVVGGDMVVYDGANQGIAAGTGSFQPWKGAIIPYQIDDAIPQTATVPQRDWILKAISTWESQTAMRFVSRGTQPDYIRFVKGTTQGACFSAVGRVGGAQTVQLVDGCTTASILHEIGHAVGLLHEQSRADRDKYVNLFLENVDPKYRYAFDKVTFTSYGEYDLNSVMQYDSYAFSTNQKPVVLTKDGKEFPYPSALSAKDAAGVSALYAKESGNRTGTNAAIALTWPKRTETAEYSLDVQKPDGTWVAPCHNALVLKKSLQVTYSGACSDNGAFVAAPSVKAFRICTAEKGDWAHAICDTKAYDGQQTSLGITP